MSLREWCFEAQPPSPHRRGSETVHSCFHFRIAPHQTKETQRMSPRGPSFGNRSGDRSIAPLIDSKSAGLLCMSVIRATSAVAATMPSKRQRQVALAGTRQAGGFDVEAWEDSA